MGETVMIKVLGLLGSARKGGNSDVLLENVIGGIRSGDSDVEVETIRLSSLNIKPCLNCGGCDSEGICVQKDDMQDLYDKLLTYDIILLSSPIYFMGVSAWAKAIIDRCQALWVRKYQLKLLPKKSRAERKGVFLSVSGMKKPTVFDGAKLTVQSFFATIHVTYLGNLLYSNIDAKGDLAKHPTAINEAKALGGQLIKEFNNPDFKLDDSSSEPHAEHDRK
jgi:multimeric flavodoxin WrbA